MRRQRGAALIVTTAAVVLSIAVLAIAMLNRGPAASNSRDVITAQTLQAAKQALLAYAAKHAARTDHAFPGRMPCPEALNSYGGANEGFAAGAAANTPDAGSCPPNTSAVLGRLPWKTLGIDLPRDGDGESLWYAVSANFRPETLPGALNFGTAAALPFDAGAVVAVIIAPGAPLNTLADGGTPPAPCTKVNQFANRFATPLDPAKFLECGNSTGAYASLGEARWTNDRAIAITQAEWVAAIAGAVAARVQRQVAPALNDWRTANAWGINFLPYASSFSDPATNDTCGDMGVSEGLLPAVSAATTSCSGWASASVSALLLTLFPATCAPDATHMECSFWGISFLFGTNLFSARVSATAPRVAASFRKPISQADIQVSGAGTNVTNFSLAVSPATGAATIQFDVSKNLGFLEVFNTTVRIPHLPDADLFADPRMTWFLGNDWHRHTYYAVAPSQTINPAACVAAGNPGCLEVRGLPASTEPASGPHWNKRFVLLLAGPALATQDRTCPTNCDNLTQYLEEHNASAGDRTYRANLRVAHPSAPVPPYPPFNDHLATCPLQLPTDSGTSLLCN